MIEQPRTIDHAILDHTAVLEAVARRVLALDSVQWETPRAPDKWSPAQEVSHLILSYTGFTAELRDGPSVTPDTFPPRAPELRGNVLPRILRGNWFPTGATSPRLAMPTAVTTPPNDLLERLLDSVRAFEMELIAIRSEHPERHVRHPYFGALTLDELLRVCIEHTRHHLSFLPISKYEQPQSYRPPPWRDGDGSHQ